MQTFTVKDLIKEAYRKIGVVGQGVELTNDQLQQGVFNLNLIIDSWNVDGKMIYSEVIQQFPVSNGNISYTFGPGGDWDVPVRPANIQFASFVLTSNTPNLYLPMRIISSAEWSSIQIEQIGTSISTVLYCDHNWPLATVYVWPQSQSAQFIRLTYWNPLNSNLVSTDTFSMPPAYARGLMLDLAMNLAPNYGKPIPGDIAAIVNGLKTQINDTNVEPRRLNYDIGTVSGTYNVLTDQVGRVY